MYVKETPFMTFGGDDEEEEDITKEVSSTGL